MFTPVVRSSIEQPKRSFFDLKNVTESLSVALKPRPNYGRLHVILLIINFSIFMFCMNTFHYDYLLVIKRYKKFSYRYNFFRGKGFIIISLPIFQTTVVALNKYTLTT